MTRSRAPRSLLLSGTLAVLAACSDQPPQPLAPAPDGAAAAARADGQIPTRQQERPGTLIEKSDAELWSYVAAAGNRVTVGLKKPGAPRGTWKGSVLMTRDEWAQGRAAVLNQRGVRVERIDDLLPTVELTLDGPAALSAIRKLPMVDYVEPVMVQQEIAPLAGVGGCSWGSAWTGDRQYTASGDVYSQKLTAMNVPGAWAYSGGAGMTIGLIDTGISSTQTQFTTSAFTSGESAGRWIKFLYVSPTFTSAWDECGHGTRMAGIIAAPRDGSNVGGIAYKANLVSVRHANGVAAVSSSDAKYSVRGAAQNGSRVVVMAWESLNWLWQVSDEIEYWHYGQPILFLGAAGTSGCGDGILDSNVVFPADMPEVVAVTGINYPGGGVPCGIHHGSDVEVTAYLSLPSTGRYAADVVEMGGSSNATAVMGSIAALVWSANPSLSRDQVRARLQQAGAYYPSRHPEEGYGLVNALKAVRGY